MVVPRRTPVTDHGSAGERASCRATGDALAASMHAQLRRARRWPSRAARAAGSGTPTAGSTSTCRRHRGQLARPRPPGPRRGRRPGRSPRSRTSPTSSCRAARCARRAAARPARPPAAGSSSPTPAPRPTRPRSSWPSHGGPGRTHIVAAEGGFHGRTMGALALTGKPSIRDPFGPFPVDVRLVPYGDADGAAAAVTDDCAAVILEPDPGRDRRGARRPTATSRPPGRSPTRPARCWSLDEVQTGDRPHRALVRAPGRRRRARRRHPGQGPRRRPADRRVRRLRRRGHAVRQGRARHHLRRQPGLLRRGARRARHHRARRPARPRAARSASSCADGIDALGHPLLAGVRGRGLLLGIVLTEPAVRARCRPRRPRPGFLVNALQPDAIRLAPPLVLTAEQADAFVAALPRDPRRGRRCRGTARTPRTSGTSCATTTCRPPSRPRCSTWPPR